MSKNPRNNARATPRRPSKRPAKTETKGPASNLNDATAGRIATALEAIAGATFTAPLPAPRPEPVRLRRRLLSGTRWAPLPVRRVSRVDLGLLKGMTGCGIFF